MSPSVTGDVAGAPPRIHPWLRPVRRTEGVAQFGVGAGGIVVDGISGTEVDLLRRLDGSVSASEAYRLARDAGVTTARWRDLLEQLATLNVMADAERNVRVVPVEHPAQSRRSEPIVAGVPAPQVIVEGHGTALVELVAALRSAGLPRAAGGETTVDLAIAERQRPGLVVLLGSAAIDPHRGDVWWHRGVAHLPVVLDQGCATVGPLVLGPSHAGPCLWCLERHRADRDPNWPEVMAQLGSTGQGSPEHEGAFDRPVRQAASGIVAALVVEHLRTGEYPPGVSMELSLPWPRLSHRRWARHPQCDRHESSSSDPQLSPGGPLESRRHEGDPPP